MIKEKHCRGDGKGKTLKEKHYREGSKCKALKGKSIAVYRDNLIYKALSKGLRYYRAD